MKEDRTDTILPSKKESLIRIHDCRRQLVLTESNLKREGFEIFSDNDIWRNPENNKTFLRPPWRKIANGDLEMRDIHECV